MSRAQPDKYRDQPCFTCYQTFYTLSYLCVPLTSFSLFIPIMGLQNSATAGPLSTILSVKFILPGNGAYSLLAHQVV